MLSDLQLFFVADLHFRNETYIIQLRKDKSFKPLRHLRTSTSSAAAGDLNRLPPLLGPRRGGFTSAAFVDLKSGIVQRAEAFFERYS